MHPVHMNWSPADSSARIKHKQIRDLVIKTLVHSATSVHKTSQDTFNRWFAKAWKAFTPSLISPFLFYLGGRFIIRWRNEDDYFVPAWTCTKTLIRRCLADIYCMSWQDFWLDKDNQSQWLNTLCLYKMSKLLKYHHYLSRIAVLLGFNALVISGLHSTHA